MNSLSTVRSEVLEPAANPLFGEIDSAFSSTVCLRSLQGRGFAARVLRQQADEIGWLPPSDDILLVHHFGGGGAVERWYEGTLSGNGSQPGTVTVLPAGRGSGWRVPRPVEVAHLYVSSSVVAGLAEREFGVDPRRVEIIDSFASEDLIGSALAQAIMLALEGEHEAHDALFLDAVGQAVAVHLLRRHAVLPESVRMGEQPNALSPERLRRVCDYVEAHLGEDLLLDDLARAACLSTFHLSRCFRRATGLTLHGYVMHRRVERARLMLAGRDLTLSHVAYACGFASQSHFTAVFKKALGVTPGDYRRRLD